MVGVGFERALNHDLYDWILGQSGEAGFKLVDLGKQIEVSFGEDKTLTLKPLKAAMLKLVLDAGGAQVSIRRMYCNRNFGKLVGQARVETVRARAQLLTAEVNCLLPERQPLQTGKLLNPDTSIGEKPTTWGYSWKEA